MVEEHRQTDALIIAELRSLRELVELKMSHLSQGVDDLRTQNVDYGKRINVIELWQANSMGKFAIISVAIGMGITILVAWINSHIPK